MLRETDMTIEESDRYFQTLHRLWREQGARCATCNRVHLRVDGMELAHRIPNTKVNRKVYTPEVIDDIENLRAVCRGGMYKGRSCNDFQMIGAGKPATAAALATRIKSRLASEKNAQ